jgi:hypothetical protein
VREGRAGSSILGRLISVVLVVALGVYGYTAYSGKRAQTARSVADEAPAALPVAPATGPYRCDGRTHCSQMSSCEEAMFFLRNCPNTQMDGDGNGVPCEKQWCSGRSGR